MNRNAWFVAFLSFALAACHTTKEVAVGTFRVIDAPANYIRHKIDSSDTTTTTTTTTTSDVSNPGYPVTTTPPPPAAPPPRPSSTSHRTVTASAAERTQTPPPRKISPSPTPRVAASQPTQFPVARPVPGRPGYVYSVDPNGGMVDVTGYKSGDKAKDPYTKQIFIVP